MNEIYQQAKILQPELVKIRREIHQNAEVGIQLQYTKAFVKEKLIAYGYEPQDIANSSIVATISGELPGKTMLLRADMDGLALRKKLI